jgi:hypothetical protein
MVVEESQSPAGHGLSPRRRAGLQASVNWVGENTLGAIPLLAYILTHRYRNQQPVYLCPSTVQSDSTVSVCSALQGSIVQELCILTVVIAGLAVLSFFHLGPRARRAVPTFFTHLLVVLAVASLVGGAILYAMASIYLLKETDFVTNGILVAAALSSFFLRMEEAILNA